MSTSSVCRTGVNDPLPRVTIDISLYGCSRLLGRRLGGFPEGCFLYNQRRESTKTENFSPTLNIVEIWKKWVDESTWIVEPEVVVCTQRSVPGRWQRSRDTPRKAAKNGRLKHGSQAAARHKTSKRKEKENGSSDRSGNQGISRPSLSYIAVVVLLGKLLGVRFCCCCSAAPYLYHYSLCRACNCW